MAAPTIGSQPCWSTARAVFTESRQRAIDQSGVRPGKLLKSDSQPAGNPGSKVLNKHVRRSNQFPGRPLTLGGLQVEYPPTVCPGSR